MKLLFVPGKIPFVSESFSLCPEIFSLSYKTSFCPRKLVFVLGNFSLYYDAFLCLAFLHIDLCAFELFFVPGKFLFVSESFSLCPKIFSLP